MGAIGGLVGLGGGASGTGFAGPQGAAITPGVTADQLSTAYGGAQNSLASQQALLTALQGQNGIGNQSQVYGQLQGVANGTGPNPAQAMLNQATGQNTSNQAALMAGQRGAGANVGLLARQAAQQGAANQQNAAGQAATMQANQSLNAINSAGNIAGNQVANQIGATTSNTQAQQNEQNILQNALSSQNNAIVNSQSNVNNANSQLAQTGMKGQQNLIGGVMNGIGGLLGGASGGMVKKYADGGWTQSGPTVGGGNDFPSVDPSRQVLQFPQEPGPQSSFGQYLKGWPGHDQDSGQQQQQQQQQQQVSNQDPLMSGSSKLTSGLGKAFGVGATPSMPMGASGGNVGSKLKSGGHVPGKPKVKGNSYSNDTVKALLSPGEVVIPNSVMQSGNPIDGAAKFVAAVLAKKGKK